MQPTEKQIYDKVIAVLNGTDNHIAIKGAKNIDGAFVVALYDSRDEQRRHYIVTTGIEMTHNNPDLLMRLIETRAIDAVQSIG